MSKTEAAIPMYEHIRRTSNVIRKNTRAVDQG